MDAFSAEIWQSVALTVELASVTTMILLVIGAPLAWWLARSKTALREAVAAIITLLLVLPPTALGFCVLVLLGPSGPGRASRFFLGRTLARLYLRRNRSRIGALGVAFGGAANPQRLCCDGRPSAGSCGAGFSVVCLHYHRFAAGAIGVCQSRCDWFCSYDRHIRRRDDDRRQYSRAHQGVVGLRHRLRPSITLARGECGCGRYGDVRFCGHLHLSSPRQTLFQEKHMSAGTPSRVEGRSACQTRHARAGAAQASSVYWRG
ncbi:hypothetical protein ACVWZM_002078 [Bradyrhizobium sp. USDA 4501]